MTYAEIIERLASNVSTAIVDFDRARKRGTAPTQATSEFLTNKEQGDWAERTLLNRLNQCTTSFVAVKYGRDDNIIAGDENFEEFYAQYQNELDEIGKRPDILIFSVEDFPYEERNICNWSRERLDTLVPKAKCGIEVRSSLRVCEEYEAFMHQKQERLAGVMLELKQKILEQYGQLLRTNNSEIYGKIETLSVENIHVLDFRVPSWKKTQELAELTACLKALKACAVEMKKRTFLSITPKVEDLKLVYQWIQKYNVPHYYVQVFFDKAFGISFEKILRMIGDPELRGVEYFIEADVKNQNKTTIKIDAAKEEEILQDICLPEHFSQMKRLGKGGLLFYVKFADSASTLNCDAFERLFGFAL